MPKGVGYPGSDVVGPPEPRKSSVPMLKPRKRRKLSDKVKFNTLQPPKKGKRILRPSEQMKDEGHKTSAKEELKRGVAKGLATASAGISGRGRAGRILKAGLAGAAGGAELEAAHQRFKDKAAKKRAKKAKTTVSQSAMQQKAQFHKKEHSKTEKT